MTHKAHDTYSLALHGNLVENSVLGADAGREVDGAEWVCGSYDQIDSIPSFVSFTPTL